MRKPLLLEMKRIRKPVLERKRMIMTTVPMVLARRMKMLKKNRKKQMRRKRLKVLKKKMTEKS
uniref:Uncharacterized protein n=1 Tax=Brassica oleracea TaxID=3712 RepID=A0A3P6FW41_BRAOL|nr:unnamed protein product [Brassica oleracea]